MHVSFRVMAPWRSVEWNSSFMKTAHNKLCGLLWASHHFWKETLLSSFSNTFFQKLWPQAECHCPVPLCTREGRHLESLYLQNVATHLPPKHLHGWPVLKLRIKICIFDFGLSCLTFWGRHFFDNQNSDTFKPTHNPKWSTAMNVT